MELDDAAELEVSKAIRSVLLSSVSQLQLVLSVASFLSFLVLDIRACITASFSLSCNTWFRTVMNRSVERDAATGENGDRSHWIVAVVVRGAEPTDGLYEADGASGFN